MLKWILGCLGLIVVVIVVVVWFSYSKLKDFANKPPAAVTIMAPATRVFASMNDADSMTEWRSEGLGMRATRKGLLQVGDTVAAEMKSGARNIRIHWVVSAITPDALIAFDAHDSTGKTIFTRRDSLAAMGDSTRVTSAFTMPFLDSARRGSDTAAPKAAIGFVGQVMASAMRLQSEGELRKLKLRIEGGAPVAPAKAPATPGKKKP